MSPELRAVWRMVWSVIQGGEIKGTNLPNLKKKINPFDQFTVYSDRDFVPWLSAAPLSAVERPKLCKPHHPNAAGPSSAKAVHSGINDSKNGGRRCDEMM